MTDSDALVVEKRRVYVALRGGLVKVGISADPKVRRRQFGRHAKLIYVLACDDHAAAVERRAHEILKDARRYGEWFDVHLETAIQAVKAAVIDVEGGRCEKKTTMMTFRIDGDFLDAVEEIRTWSSPVPTKSEAIRRAVLEMHDRLARSERKRAHAR